jgi:tripartite-type tricarboxylate transporter receptor subunit TctC
MHRLTLLILPAIAALVAIAAPLRAADWPSRSVTVVVPFAAGGNTDMMARLGAQHLSAKLGQTFVVENRPSAGGALGTGMVAAAAPDGYTILFAASSMITLTPQLQKLNFNPEQQLVPITNVGTGTQMIAIKRELPVKTLPELIAYAKANPGKLNFTVAGTQNISHLAPVLLFARAGIDLVMVPSKGGPQAVSDVMSGQVDLYFGNSSELLPHIEPPLRPSPRPTAMLSWPSSTMPPFPAPTRSPSARASRPCSTGSQATACAAFWWKARIASRAI